MAKIRAADKFRLKPSNVLQPVKAKIKIKKVLDIDSTPLTFGKYEGKTPTEIAEEDPSYIIWLYEKVDPKLCSKELVDLCEWDDRDDDDEETRAVDEHFGLNGW